MGDARLAGFLCSRLCHDLVGPIGAFNNGMEILSEESDRAMQEQAMELLADSAREAAGRLQFFRVAFGAAGEGEQVAFALLQRIAGDMFARGRVTLAWEGEAVDLSRARAKLFFNLLLLAAGSLPRGGALNIRLAAAPDRLDCQLVAKGVGVRLGDELAAAMAAGFPGAMLGAGTVLIYHAAELAALAGKRLEIGPLAEDRLGFGLAPA